MTRRTDATPATRSTPSSRSCPPTADSRDIATPDGVERKVEIELDAAPLSAAGPAASFRLRFPPLRPADASGSTIDQDEEWCEAEIDGRWRRIRFHDYHEVFEVPGLYEALFARRLKCASPQRVASLLEDVLSDFPQDPADLRVLDVGAGNGMVGEELRRIGVEHLIGIDIIPEARTAALRDRPGVYRDYLVADLTRLGEADARRIESFRPNCLTVVAALGYGDIPTDAFLAACEFVPVGGWIVFNIKEDFLAEGEDQSGFAAMIRTLQADRSLEIQALRRYRHRLSIHGEPLPYIAIVASKKASFEDGDGSPPA